MYRRGRSLSKPKAWFERSDGHVLRAEEALVREFYPGLRFRLDADDGRMNLEGDFVLQTDCGITNSIAIRVVFPRNYPNFEPSAFDAGGRFPVSLDRHIIKGGQFCLWLPPCSPWDKEDPKRLLRFLDEVAAFLERQMIFEATGIWPGDHYRHGRHGYEQFMSAILDGNVAHLAALFPVILGKADPGRNELCPCGSEKKYKRCHSDAVAEIVGRIGRGTLDFYYSKPRKGRSGSSGNSQGSTAA